jgi:hypothetical protein
MIVHRRGALSFVIVLTSSLLACGCSPHQDGALPPGQQTPDLAVGPIGPGEDGGASRDFAIDPNTGGCLKRTCAELDATCGLQGDGCGGTLDCGECKLPDTCGGGGKPNACGHQPGGTCTPRDCKSVGANCGPLGDGCGGVLDCGECKLPDICGGGGKPSVCGNNSGPTCTGLCQQQMPCTGGGDTTISGTVFAPTDATLGYGNPDPLYGALVYVPNGTVEPFKPGVSCQQCSAQASGSPLIRVTTGPDGKFKLGNAPIGKNIPLVIQLGRWRRQIVIPEIKSCVDTALTAEQTRLPRKQSEGDIPRIAIVTGDADPVECVLPKIGIDPAEFTLPSGNGRVHIFQNDGAHLGFSTPSQSALLDDPAVLAKYDMVIIDCAGGEVDEGVTVRMQKNLVAYADAGGRVFTTHYGFAWLYDAPSSFSSAAQWAVDHQGNSVVKAGQTGFIDTGAQKGKDFSQWLTNVKATTTPGQIHVDYTVKDSKGVNAPTQQWLYGTRNNENHPLEFSFDTPVGKPAAAQCGRVLFSDFHVNTGGTASGRFPGECGDPSAMTPQEKVLEFMLFDLSSCIAPEMPQMPTCTPRTCADQHLACGPAGDGCGKLIQCGECMKPDTCGGSGTPGMCGHTATCHPRSCLEQNIDCGPAGDGCGNLLQCGECKRPETCGGGGVPGKCGGIT